MDRIFYISLCWLEAYNTYNGVLCCRSYARVETNTELVRVVGGPDHE